MNAQQLLDAALALVKSESIRKWATSERNLPIWLEIAGNYPKNPSMLCIYIVSTAMGL